MMPMFTRWLLAAGLLVALGQAVAAEATASGGQPLVGIDHMPTVVADLDKASATYRRLGFALKPGRVHGNGLRNTHIKFKDGAGIELISVPAAPADDMTRSYAALLRAGEGPACIAFHARDTGGLTSALAAAGIGFGNDDGVVTLDDPNLEFVFFVRDNRSPTDKPQHFAHANGATAMNEVWLAVDASTLASLRKLFAALGVSERIEDVMAPGRARAHVFQLRNGRVLALPARHQRLAGRPIIGAEFLTSGKRRTVKPAAAHGLWLHLAPQP